MANRPSRGQGANRRPPPPGLSPPLRPRSGAPPDRWTRPPSGATYPQSLIDQPLTGPGRSGSAEPTRSTELAGSAAHGLMLVLVAIFGYLLVYSGGTQAVAALGWQSSGRPGTYTEFYNQSVSQFGSPWGIWAAHLGLALLILLVWVAYRFHHHRQLAWLWSVGPGVRWRYGLLCLLLAVVVVGAFAGLAYLGSEGWNPPGDWAWFLLAIIVTSPFQALGEEVLFRGYLMQAFGLVWSRPWFPILASATLFALFHGAQNPWLFLSRLAFGLLAGALVWRTGGLEAAVAAHVVNNLAAFSLALFTGQLQATRTMTEVSWLAGLSDVGLFAVFAAAAWAIAWAMRVPRQVA